ncbi:MAG: hypothetical protein ABJN98_12245 [Roseibium sp.]|uniref:hypothetical protein n=1 Tax=Roseibium polysiphoniae TaxID=2571221 RepID=UPI003297F23C
MTGKLLLDKIYELAEKKNPDAEDAVKLLKMLGGTTRQDAEKASTQNGAIKIIEDSVAIYRQDLKDTKDFAIRSIDAYNADQTPDKPTFHAWVELQAADKTSPNMDMATNLLAVIKKPSMEELGGQITAAKDANSVSSIVETRSSDLSEAYKKLNAVTRTIENDTDHSVQKPTGEDPSQGAKLTTIGDFLEYLAEQEAIGDANAANIRKILKKSQLGKTGKALPLTFGKVIDAIDDHAPPELNNRKRQMLKSASNQLFGNFNQQENPDGLSKEERLDNVESWLQRKPRVFPSLTIVLIVLLAGALILLGFDDEKLQLLSNNDTARGFITLLFAVGAISIFMIITAAIVFDIYSDPRHVYERAKTILSMLLGIFGTVLGFYFGSLGEDRSEPFTLKEITLVSAGQTLNFAAVSEGGSAPYQYVINVVDQTGARINEATRFLSTEKSAFSLKTPLKLDKYAGQSVTIVVEGQDSRSSSALVTSKSYEVPGPTKVTPVPDPTKVTPAPDPTKVE